MLSDLMKRSLRRQLTQQLTETRRRLKDQEQRLARLRYEWGIAKRLRSQSRSEDEREKWRVQSDVYMGLVMQQESSIKEIRESIERYQLQLAELDAALTGETKR